MNDELYSFVFTFILESWLLPTNPELILAEPGQKLLLVQLVLEMKIKNIVLQEYQMNNFTVLVYMQFPKALGLPDLLPLLDLFILYFIQYMS